MMRILRSWAAVPLDETSDVYSPTGPITPVGVEQKVAFVILLIEADFAGIEFDEVIAVELQDILV